MRNFRNFGLATFFSGALLIIALVATPAQAEIVHDFNIGGPGSQKGKFQKPSSVAVNETTGDLYVTDSGNHRIQRFDSAGNFISAWGLNVDATNPSSGYEICTDVSGDECQAATKGSTAGAFATPVAIAINNSGGPANGAVYVVDQENNRVQRFAPDGQFVLMWGRGVNLTTGGDICTAASGNTCAGGGITGNSTTTPVTPSQPGEFSGWLGNGYAHNIATDGNGFVYVTDQRAVTPIPGFPNGAQNGRIEKFDASGNFVSQTATKFSGQPGGIQRAGTVAVSTDGSTIWINGRQTFGEETVRRYSADDFTATGLEGGWDLLIDQRGMPTVDPSNQYLFATGTADNCVDGASGAAVFEYRPNGEALDCTTGFEDPGWANGSTNVMMNYTISLNHKMYVPNGPTNSITVYTVPRIEKPLIQKEKATEITANKAAIRSEITPRLGITTFHVDYGTSPCSFNPCQSTPESNSIGATVAPKPAAGYISGLQPATRYYYRVVATNDAGSTNGVDKSFISFPNPEFDPSCANNLARQQTGAAFLLDCRAYELVSAEDQGGYDVTSNLIPGQEPFGGYPDASNEALYSIHNGGVPGVGKPTNRGPDPYLATRDPENQRWNTEYVGIPADAPSLAPFSSRPSGADAGLDTLAFDGADICAPCFPDGSRGIPIRLPDGEIVQGMVGSMPVAMPVSAAGVKKQFSGDGKHFLFASEQQFELAGNPDDGNVTIYDRNLTTNTTQVVSTMPDGSTIANGADVRVLDVSADGSRVLIGIPVSTSEGSDYYDLYMHEGNSPQSIELADTVKGVLFSGMTSDGSQVFFTSRDNFADDTDGSVDLFRATVDAGTSTVERVSTGENGTGDIDGCDPAANSYNSQDWNTIPGGPTDCSVVAVGGGGGVAKDTGSVYFLSPEKLDGSGVEGAPNLFLARPGDDPQFVTTLESSAATPLGPPSPKFDHFKGSFSRPVGAAIDRHDGSFYVFDTDEAVLEPGASVQKFDSSGNPDMGFGTGSKLTGFTALGDGSLLGFPAGVPAGIAVDNNSASPNYRDLYVPDGAGSVNRYSSSGVLEKSIPVGGFFEPPSSVGVDPTTGRIYVPTISLFSGTSTVYVFNSSGVPVAPTSFAVSGLALGIAVDSAGKVYIANGSETEIYNGSNGNPIATLDSHPSVGVSVDPGVFANPSDDVIYVDEGEQVTSFDSAGDQLVEAIGSGHLSGSVSLAADSAGMIVSNPDAGNVAIFTPAAPPNRAYDSPLVIASVRDAEVDPSDRFQTTPSGDHAVFSAVLPLTGFDSDNKYELFRYDAGSNSIVCASCNPTDVSPSTDAALPSLGLGVADDGRVFFNTGEPLVLRDTNEKLDAYEWSGRAELISSGQSSVDSGLLSISSDGTDAFFFTRDTLTKNDANGNAMKLYTAREGGGFFQVPPPPPCAASDECHGPGSKAAPPIDLGTLKGSGGNAKAALHCRKGQVKRSGKCVKRRKGRTAKHDKRRHHNTTRRHG